MNSYTVFYMHNGVRKEQYFIAENVPDLLNEISISLTEINQNLIYGIVSDDENTRVEGNWCSKNINEG